MAGASGPLPCHLALLTVVDQGGRGPGVRRGGSRGRWQRWPLRAADEPLLSCEGVQSVRMARYGAVSQTRPRQNAPVRIERILGKVDLSIRAGSKKVGSRPTSVACGLRDCDLGHCSGCKRMNLDGVQAAGEEQSQRFRSAGY